MSGDLLHQHLSWLLFLVTLPICLIHSEDYLEDRVWETIFP